MKKVVLVFGTRPEAIKLAPVALDLKARPEEFDVRICVTAQHRRMLDQVLELFAIVPDYDLNVMTEDQDLFQVTATVLCRLKEVLQREAPDLVLVQGDTTTTLMASLAAYYLKIPVGHVEAGLRSRDKYHPFPEEKNRQLTSALADYHFAPTEGARRNLLAEGVPEERVWVTGNTAIDALLWAAARQRAPERRVALAEYFRERWGLATDEGRFLLATAHRRESFGPPLENICLGLREIAAANPDVRVVYPVHPNPQVRASVCRVLGKPGEPLLDNVFLTEPLDYASFVYLLSHCYLVLTDSGGIQEEAPSLGKPVLVLRETTERPEGVASGNARLVGTDSERILAETQRLLDDPKAYQGMASPRNPYGDGHSAQRIAEILARC